MFRLLILIAAVVWVMIIPIGCIAVGGSPHVNHPTMGRELMDLKTALEQEAITEAEYHEAKASLLRDR